ncbi:DUF5522 domain-containing protein [Penaeicola halotolerans]|uniref:DUF5522 domain-containing protein n=1 Tax=Penaeicola halotolerans TaxID=2793196 RepID=UPI001CF9084B|nr:DUF5522 domain-containing protein [Penaeicola halotolerans]
MANRKQSSAPMTLQEGDFYLNESGLMVFTAQYHLRRGYCCGNGCKHCPYPTGATKNQKLKK